MCVITLLVSLYIGLGANASILGSALKYGVFFLLAGSHSRIVNKIECSSLIQAAAFLPASADSAYDRLRKFDRGIK